MSPLTPDEIVDRRFTIALRGYDRAEVEEFLGQLAAELTQLTGQLTQSAALAPEVHTELDAVAAEVGRILAAAKQAAEGLRTRAHAEATRWRQEAERDAEGWRKEAKEESDRLRGDAESFAARIREEATLETERVAAEAAASASRARNESTAEADRVRRQADEYANRLREEADTFAAQLRKEVEVEASGRRSSLMAEFNRMREETEAINTNLRLEAERAAEAARTAAWTEASGLLDQVQTEAAAGRRQAVEESLSIKSDAELNAHRLLSTSRQSAEEERRAARVEAERLLVDAQARHDEIIEAARRAAEAAQERAKALERRREELMTQLETAQQAIKTLDGELQSRRDILKAQPPLATDLASVKVVPAKPTPMATEEGVRVLPADDLRARKVDADELMAEVRGLRQRLEETRIAALPPAPETPALTEIAPPQITPGLSAPDLSSEPAPIEPTPPSVAPIPTPRISVTGSGPTSVESTTQPAAAGQVHKAAELMSVSPVAPKPEMPKPAPVAAGDPVGSLFAGLREKPAAKPRARPAKPAVPEAASVTTAERAFETRDRLLLAELNRAVRELKRHLSKAQGEALEKLREKPRAWKPNRDGIEEAFAIPLGLLFSSSHQAGVAAASELAGLSAQKLATPRSRGVREIAAGLADELENAYRGADPKDARQLQVEIGGVFRGWRNTEAERRALALGQQAYHAGLLAALARGGVSEVRWALAGRGCDRCQAGRVLSIEDAKHTLPPVHPGCACTLLPA